MLIRPALLSSILAAVAFAAPALSHPLPRAETPAPNAVLPASPARITITFSENLVAAFSRLDLKTAAGKPVTLGPASVDPRNRAVLSAPVKSTLTPGAYVVDWSAVGDDTHHVSGHYGFQVR